MTMTAAKLNAAVTSEYNIQKSKMHAMSILMSDPHITYWYDIALEKMRIMFADFPGHNFLDDTPYLDVVTGKSDDGEYTSRILAGFYPYFYSDYPYFYSDENRADIYDWCLDRCKIDDKPTCDLSYDGKRISFRLSTFSDNGHVEVSVRFDIQVPEDDEWMLRSLGKLQIREIPARTEQCVVCS